MAVVAGFMALAVGACSGPSNQASAPAGASGAATAGAPATAGTAMGQASQPTGARTAASTATPASMAPAATTSVAESPRGGQGLYLHVLMQKPDFASAYKSMAGSDKLPEWVKTGGTATKATLVNIDGKEQLVAEACMPHDCPLQKVVLIYDTPERSMQGVFVNDQHPGPEAGISDKAQLTWLGHPDDAVKKWLETRLKSPQKFQ